MVWAKAVIAASAALALAGCDSEVEKRVRERLLDPDSAQFRNIKKCTSDPNITMGDVNSKNSYGGYTGYEPFYVHGYSVIFSTDRRYEMTTARCFSELPRVYGVSDEVLAAAKAERAARLGKDGLPD